MKLKKSVLRGIGGKVLLTIVILIIITAITISTIAVINKIASMEELSFDKLKAVQSIKQKELINRFKIDTNILKSFANQMFIATAVKNLDTLSKEAKSQGYMGLRLLEYGPYKEEFDKYYGYVKSFKELNHYYDVFIFSPNSGRVLLTVAKEKDFGTELKRETHHLAKAWQKLKETKKLQLTDIKPYAPSNNEPAIFMLYPSYKDGRYVGSVGFQISFEEIDEIMQEKAGMGESGEAYVVGEDLLMRSNSRFLKSGETSILKQKVDSVSGRSVNDHKLDAKDTSAQGIIKDYRGIEVLSVYGHAHINEYFNTEFDWAVIAEIDKSEVYAPIYTSVFWIIFFAAIIVAAALFVGTILARRIGIQVENGYATANSLVVNNIEPVISTNKKLVVENINEAALKLLGYTRKEVVGKMKYTELCKYPITDEKNSSIAQCMDSKAGMVNSTIATTKSGEVIPVRAVTGPLLDSENNPVGGFEIISNIKQIDEGFLDNMADPAFRTDENLLIQNINDSALKAMGYTKEEVIGKMTCADMCKTTMCGTNECTIKRCMNGKKTIIEETIATTKSGQTVPVRAACGFLSDANGNVTGGFEVITDNTAFVKMVETTQQVANGDLTVTVDKSIVERNDAAGQLAKAMKKMVEDLKTVISNIMISAQNLSQAVQEISSGNENLSQRTSEQASTIEEIASTIEEATSTINQNSDNSDEANSMSKNSLQLAQEGGQIVDDSINAIIEINDSSKKIGEIIAVINEIAFQTNLLALNAAVEAARAGEQGRGFAVVAGEVRNLAQRAGNAAKEIEDLIKDSLEKVDKGTELSNKSGESLKEIISGITSVSSRIAEIAAATNEQKQGMTQINTAITEMDSMTQQNASLVEETASASEEMANQAQELLSLVEKFKVDIDTSKTNVSSRKHIQLNQPVQPKINKDVEKIPEAKKKVETKADKITKTIPPKKPDTSEDKIMDILSSDGFEQF